MCAHLRRMRKQSGSDLLAAAPSFRGVSGLARVSFSYEPVVDPSSLHTTNTGKHCRKIRRGPHRSLHTDPYPLVRQVHLQLHLQRAVPQRRAAAYFQTLSQPRCAGSARDKERDKTRGRNVVGESRKSNSYIWNWRLQPCQCLPRA